MNELSKPCHCYEVNPEKKLASPLINKLYALN